LSLVTGSGAGGSATSRMAALTSTDVMCKSYCIPVYALHKAFSRKESQMKLSNTERPT
jgi:hypothetical protein